PSAVVADSFGAREWYSILSPPISQAQRFPTPSDSLRPWSQRSGACLPGRNLKAQAARRRFTCLSCSSLTAWQSFWWRGPTSNKLPDGHLGLLNVESLLFTLPNRRNLNACLGAVLFHLRRVGSRICADTRMPNTRHPVLSRKLLQHLQGLIVTRMVFEKIKKNAASLVRRAF